MRIATITNWAYGATVCLTIASGIIMLMASSADTLERQAVEQRQKFDQLTEDIETDIWAQSDLARLYVIKKDPCRFNWSTQQLCENMGLRRFFE
ncbi:DeoR faimly transcriptional regulator [Enterobacter asburiae]|nr:DeoR faimly transcriptional regulator [Enterobacter asburiae]